MKLTFEEYLDSYKNEPDWIPRPTFEEYEKIQEECLLAEFLGYKEYPNTILHRYDEEGLVKSLKSALYFADSYEAYDICLQMIKYIMNNDSTTEKGI